MFLHTLNHEKHKSVIGKNCHPADQCMRTLDLIPQNTASPQAIFRVWLNSVLIYCNCMHENSMNILLIFSFFVPLKYFQVFGKTLRRIFRTFIPEGTIPLISILREKQVEVTWSGSVTPPLRHEPLEWKVGLLAGEPHTHTHTPESDSFHTVKRECLGFRCPALTMWSFLVNFTLYQFKVTHSSNISLTNVHFTHRTSCILCQLQMQACKKFTIKAVYRPLKCFS